MNSADKIIYRTQLIEIEREQNEEGGINIYYYYPETKEQIIIRYAPKELIEAMDNEK